MQAYEKQLWQSCELWFRENYGIHLTQVQLRELYSGTLFQPNQAPADRPEYHLSVAIGPWKSLYVKFKQPGESLSVEEKNAIRQLRDWGHRVEIIRCMEDFRTLIEWYLPVALYA